MNNKKPKVTKSDLNIFFSNCLRPGSNFRVPGPNPAKQNVPYPPGFLQAQQTIPKRIASPFRTGDRGDGNLMAIHESSFAKPTQSNLRLSPHPLDKVTIVKPLTQKRNSYVCLTNLHDAPRTHKQHRRSLQSLMDPKGHYRSVSRDGSGGRPAPCPVPPYSHPTQSPTHLFNLKSLGLMTRGQATRSSGKRHSDAGIHIPRVQTRREFKSNFRDFLDHQKSDKLRINFENFVQRKTPFSKQQSQPGAPEVKLFSIHDKLARISQLIDRGLTLKTPTADTGTQKAYKRFHEVNFVNSNVGDLLKDIAKAELLERRSASRVKSGQTTGGAYELRLKRAVIDENVRMMQEHVYFEEFLQVLAERGVDVENMFAYCNQRLKIKRDGGSGELDGKREPTSASITEVSLLDIDRLAQGRPKGVPPKLRMDFSRLQKYTTSDSENGEE